MRQHAKQKFADRNHLAKAPPTHTCTATQPHTLREQFDPGHLIETKGDKRVSAAPFAHTAPSTSIKGGPAPASKRDQHQH